ncbi:hypothetical protein GOODEAATRI_024649 [Goodea atripinnis]|uniref:Uncharacterized protein n=1 Tax=Goodea atripinnis TaxID=208336 RepID=A0ABV0NET0_9TELE
MGVEMETGTFSCRDSANPPDRYAITAGKQDQTGVLPVPASEAESSDLRLAPKASSASSRVAVCYGDFPFLAERRWRAPCFSSRGRRLQEGQVGCRDRARPSGQVQGSPLQMACRS